MGRTWGMAFAVSLLIASTAAADIPLPNNVKYVDPRVSFEGIDKHADYVFYLRYFTFTGNPSGIPETIAPVKDSKAFNLNAGHHLSVVRLMAMDRKDFDKRTKEDSSLKWFNEKTEGVLQTNLPVSNTAPADIKEEPVKAFHISIKDGKLSTELLDEKKKSEAPSRLLPTWAFGLVGSLSLGWFGIWFTRSRKRKIRG